MSERWFPDTMPSPMANLDTLPWWRAAAEERLTLQRCADCGRLRNPPAPICPRCRSREFDWPEVQGTGYIYTYTVVHRPVAADQTLPFIIIAVELDGTDGTRLLSNLVDADPERVAVGQRVELVWERMGPEVALPRFRPARAG